MNLRDFEYLVALDEHRHFGRAAAACYASQPTLSTQLRKLETELGAELVERGSRQVIFTAVGERVVRRARRILSEVDEIRDIARYASQPYAGTLKLGGFPTLAPYLLPHVMGPLADAFPDLQILLVEAKTDELLDQLRGGSLDAALIALPVVGDAFTVAPLFREEFVLAASSGHPLAEGSGEVSPGALSGNEVLLLTEGHCLRDQALDVCSQAGAEEQQGFQATSLETLRLMVAAGSAITLLPRLAVSPPVPATPGIVLREFGAPRPHRDIALVSRRGSVHRDVLREVAQCLRGVTDLPVIPLAED